MTKEAASQGSPQDHDAAKKLAELHVADTKPPAKTLDWHETAKVCRAYLELLSRQGEWRTTGTVEVCNHRSCNHRLEGPNHEEYPRDWCPYRERCPIRQPQEPK